ncbi:MAG TPA: clostripain-related cysteine peptidase [Clostridia bacterium]|nr:clostripain-related cysteine peptidase [Clostridia bacterium]
MRRRIAFGLIAALLIALLPPLRALCAQPSVTVLLYMNGSDLESENGAATNNLEQILASRESPNVTLLMQTGGTRSWNNDYISSNRTQRFERSGSRFDLVEELARTSIGEPDTLADFIAWGVSYAPADRYILLFWNHGLGPIGGFGVDEYFDCGINLYSGDTLTLSEMYEGLSKAWGATGARFDLIGFDCCLMASLEVAQVCAPFGQVLVASEESEPEYGWDYGALLNALAKDPGMDPEALGKVIADSYFAQCKRHLVQGDVTLSVVRLANIPAVTQALDQLVLRVDRAFAQEPDYFYGFTQRALRAKAYGGMTEEEGYVDMVDLDDLAWRLSDQYSAEAQAVRAAVRAAVSYQVTGWQQQQASGLAVYLPLRDREYFYESLAVYDQTQASEIYKLFVSAYALGLLDPDNVEGDVLTAYQTQSQMAASASTPQPEATRRPFVGGVLGAATAKPEAAAIQEDLAQAWSVFLESDALPQADDFFTSDIWLDEQGGYCHVTIDPDRMDRIDLIYFTLATPYEDDKLLLLGQDSNLTVDAETGDVQEWFEGYWFALDGHFVMPELVEETDEYIRYAIPALLDGKLISIHASYLWPEDPDAPGTYEIHGYRNGNDAGVHDTGRILQQMEPDQVLTPLFRLYDVETGTSELVEGQPFTLSDAPALEDEEVPDGEYALLFVVRDVLQNLYYTDYFHWEY